MKKTILLVLLGCFTMMTMNAQIGIRGGLNLANVSINSEGLDITPDSKIGFHFGVVYDINAGEKSAIRVGALYSGKGYNFSQEFFGTKIEQNASFNYLEVPVSYVYHINGKAKGLFLEGGINLGMLLSANVTTDGNSEDVKEDLKSIDLGAGLGLGYKVMENISIGLNYSLGLTNIAEDAGGDSLKNKGFMLYGIYHL